MAGTPGVPEAIGGLVIELPWGDPDRVEAALRGREGDLAAIIIEPVQGAGGIRAAGAGFLALPSVVTRPRRRAADLRRDHLVPGGARRRPGAFRRPAGPDDARQDHRRWLPARGVRRPGGRDGDLRRPARRRGQPRRHVQRQSGRRGGRAGDAPRADARRPTSGSTGSASGFARRSPATIARDGLDARVAAVGSLFQVCAGEGVAAFATGAGQPSELYLASAARRVLIAPRGMGAIPTVATEARRRRPRRRDRRRPGRDGSGGGAGARALTRRPADRRDPRSGARSAKRSRLASPWENQVMRPFDRPADSAPRPRPTPRPWSGIGTCSRRRRRRTSSRPTRKRSRGSRPSNGSRRSRRSPSTSPRRDPRRRSGLAGAGSNRAEIREPGTIERAWGSGGAGFGLGSWFMATLAGSFIGSAIAQSFFDNDPAHRPTATRPATPRATATRAPTPTRATSGRGEGDFGGDVGGGGTSATSAASDHGAAMRHSAAPPSFLRDSRRPCPWINWGGLRGSNP